MPLKINGSTSGSVTLAAPATGSDVTVTLPGSTMNLATELSAKVAKQATDANGNKITTSAAGNTNLVVQRIASQTAPLVDFWNEGGGSVANIDKDGHYIATWQPYAFAAGTVSATPSGTTVTFPASRFSVGPVVTIGPAWVSANGALGNAVVIEYPGSTSTSIILRSVSASAVIAHWMAVQMTSSSAAG